VTHSTHQPTADATRTLIDELLEAQHRLQTPAARFSETHDHAPKTDSYRDLIPLSAPGPGEQYAFQVDLDACTGCKACVSACHSLNGLDDNETWRDVGLIHGGAPAAPYQQTVTTACHHCADPGCLNGCPVLAYEKDPLTGIVRHLDDQCIGCQYCVLKCPYDVPKYNKRLGVVRKCDMCHSRLAVGEAPACAQACPTHAIKIVNVTTHVNGLLQPDTAQFLAAAPAPDYTLPTTRYVSHRPPPSNAIAADAATLRPQPPHWPLVLMLTGLPMATGCFTLAGFAPEHAKALDVIGWLAGAAGLACSVFHLGQPLRAWRVFLGLRTSWLSREAVVFGGWFGLATLLTAARAPWPVPASPLAMLILALEPLVILTGTLGLFCSVMIYVDTRRPFWRIAQTVPRFFGTAIVLSLAAYFALDPDYPLALSLAAVTALKLAVELRVLRPLDDEDETPTPARKTAQLLAGPLRVSLGARLVFAVLGAVLVPLMVSAHQLPLFMAWIGLALAVIGEVAERYLYFRAVVAPKMPGFTAS